jgi:hypothetical protein
MASLRSLAFKSLRLKMEERRKSPNPQRKRRVKKPTKGAKRVPSKRKAMLPSLLRAPKRVVTTRMGQRNNPKRKGVSDDYGYSQYPYRLPNGVFACIFSNVYWMTFSTLNIRFLTMLVPAIHPVADSESEDLNNRVESI